MIQNERQVGDASKPESMRKLVADVASGGRQTFQGTLLGGFVSQNGNPNADVMKIGAWFDAGHGGESDAGILELGSDHSRHFTANLIRHAGHPPRCIRHQQSETKNWKLEIGNS
jgi:hypothetical protein